MWAEDFGEHGWKALAEALVHANNQLRVLKCVGEVCRKQTNGRVERVWGKGFWALGSDWLRPALAHENNKVGVLQ